LFVFFMLVLVLGASFPVMFWAGRAWDSLYLLNRLLVHREGQRRRRQEGVHRQPHRRLRFLVAMFILFQQFGLARLHGRLHAVRHHARRGRRRGHRGHAVPVPRLHRQVGGNPLYTWLPDAMAGRAGVGPDPRATMVTPARLSRRALPRAVRSAGVANGGKRAVGA